MEIRYTGDAAGQPERVRVSGYTFTRGQVREVPASLGRILAKRPGWAQVAPKKSTRRRTK